MMGVGFAELLLPDVDASGARLRRYLSAPDRSFQVNVCLALSSTIDAGAIGFLASVTDDAAAIPEKRVSAIADTLLVAVSYLFRSEFTAWARSGHGGDPGASGSP